MMPATASAAMPVVLRRQRPDGEYQGRPVMGSDAGTLVFMPRLSICGCPGHVEIGFPCAFASGVAVAGVGINYQEGFGRYPQIASVSVGRGRDARPRYR